MALTGSRHSNGKCLILLGFYLTFLPKPDSAKNELARRAEAASPTPSTPTDSEDE